VKDTIICHTAGRDLRRECAGEDLEVTVVGEGQAGELVQCEPATLCMLEGARLVMSPRHERTIQSCVS
jgi:hypothetical protein